MAAEPIVMFPNWIMPSPPKLVSKTPDEVILATKISGAKAPLASPIEPVVAPPRRIFSLESKLIELLIS